ncbi:putative efflux protein, MATE family [Bacteroidales bacterium WCE2008]|nr:putative efflux protein, MATE family [Bacteroidales bacterium WCE2008]
MAAGAIPTKLGTQKISSLLISYAVPGIIAMAASSLYNMVDRAFIGHIEEVGPLAISGLAVTFPLMNISAALGTLVGVGGSTMISVLLGQKNYDVANKVLGNVVSLNVAVGVLFTILTLAFINPILTFFGASENTLPFARDYMTIIAIGNVVTHLYFGLNSVIRSSGNPKLAMGLTLFTVISNAILDPVMIYGLGMGIRGAATATVICQTLAMIFTLKYFLNKERFLHIPKKLVLDVRIARDSLAIGMGPFLMNLASCIVVLFINQQLLKYGGDLAIGAYGIVNSISFMFVMTVMGFNQGMQPIAGYNYGARQYSRVKEVYTLTAFWATLVTLLGFIISEFLSGPVVSIFTHDPEMKKLAITGIRAMNVAFPIVGFQMVTTNLFQCLGMVHKSIFLSLSRQLLFLVPCIYILPGILGSEMGVWYSFPISDTIAAVLTAILAVGLIRKLRKLKDGDDPSILGSKI